MFRRIGSTYRDAFSGLPRPVWWLAFATLGKVPSGLVVAEGDHTPDGSFIC
jgi:hypothetical protein